MPFRDLPGVTQCRFRRGEILIHAGEQMEYVYYLIKGTVYREMVSDSGHACILTRKVNGSIVRSLVGFLALYREPIGVSRNDFVAYNTCLCYRIPKDVCQQYLRQHPDLLEDVIYMAMEEYSKLLEIFQAKNEGCVAGRLCSLLLERAKESEQGLLVSRKFTNVEMAKFLSVHEVTVGRILRVLREEQTIMRVAEGWLLCDPLRLQQYADNEIKLKY